MQNKTDHTAKFKEFIKRAAPLLIFISALAVILAVFGNAIIMVMSKPENIKAYVDSKGIFGMLIFIGLQIMQVVIAVIPGEPVQIAGGYLYGSLLGFVLSTAGIMIGSVIAVLISRKFGLPVARLFVSEKKLIEYKGKLESEKSLMFIFLLFLIPALPKDVILYAAGLTPINLRILFIIYFTARIPAIFLANILGALLAEKNIAGFIAVCVIVLILLIAGYLLREKIFRWIKPKKGGTNEDK
ncbi:MAG: TVP38/TMEM64 family protein [Eubacteriales bacterium]|nr:TVP38/TMEM64 family protein [Eubacteriales bacterium]